ncbi:MAG TPA: outer membrane protein assembly factor BamD [Candidatus Kapabacteria bacterium]|nr:outer membrane protein assembly factor BamD [Candidatus Kapabacteria bacterium]HPO62742.1 outer membrane protein assembly factor BamD [Candidatus Kapabacteria bacterium]
MKRTKIKKYLKLQTYCYIFLLSLLIISCSSKSRPEMMGVEEYFRIASDYFAKEDWIESQRYFDLIKLQYPASAYADDAQYYLAEINFKRGEFILSAFNYTLLRKNYPSSPYNKEALFKTGLCYYEISPRFDRDQEYTMKAIQTFAEYQTFYAGDSLSFLANKKIQELRDKLAEKEYETAVLYRKLSSPLASSIYFDVVINEYQDTKFYEEAIIGNIEVQIEMKKSIQVLYLVELYRRSFPNGKYLSFIENIAKEYER